MISELPHIVFSSEPAVADSSVDDIESLYHEVRQALADSEPLNQSQTEALLLHPQSQHRLRLACSATLRQWAGRHDLYSEVLQEAMYLVLRRLNLAAVPFRDKGPQQFGGWLWQLWLRACQHAWRHYRSILLRETTLEETEILQTRRTAPQSQWPQILTQLHAIENATLRDVMLDWAAGIDRTTTAAKQGLSKPSVTRFRGQGMAVLRSRMQETDW